MGSKARDLLPRLGLVFIVQVTLVSPAVAVEGATTSGTDQSDLRSEGISQPVMSKGVESNRRPRDSMEGIDPEELGVEPQPENPPIAVSPAQPDSMPAAPNSDATAASAQSAQQGTSTASGGTTETSAYTSEAVEHFNRGVQYQHDGQADRAIKQYRQAIEADSRMAEAYSNLGMLYSDQKDYARAKAALTKALELKPYRAMTLNALAAVLYASGHPQQAVEQWRLAVTADPQFASAYFNMGLALEEQKKYQEAGNAYSKALSVNPQFPELREHLGLPAYQDRPIQQPTQAVAQAAQPLPVMPPTRRVRTPIITAPPIEDSNFEQYQPVRTNSLLAQAVERASTTCSRDSLNEITVHARYEQLPPPARGVEFSSNCNVAFSVSQAITSPSSRPKTAASTTQPHNRTTIAYKSPITAAKHPTNTAHAASGQSAEVASEFETTSDVKMFVQPARTN